MIWRVLTGDVRERLAELPAQSIQCCVTSPPYWGLRDYGHAGQLGLEQTPDAYVAAMVDVFAGVWRVLKDDGTLWLNLGDSYTSAGGGGEARMVELHGARDTDFRRGTVEHGRSGKRPFAEIGMKPKDLVGIPWMMAFALRSAGWYLRSDIIWAKPNPMPESVTDRPTKAHEYVFLLSKSQRYFYDADAISEAALYAGEQLGIVRGTKRRAWSMGVTPSGNEAPGADADIGTTRNARSVWTITTQPYPDAHFATFPEALPERCIKAGSRVGDTVLDPFTGSGTTGAVAIRLGRSFVGVELNPAYARLAEQRIGNAAPLFAVGEVVA